MPLEDLTLSAAQLRESLALSDSVTKDATSLLDTCSSRLQDLERTVQPLALNKALRARENIKKARERAEEVLEHLDASRRVRTVGRGKSDGPQRCRPPRQQQALKANNPLSLPVMDELCTYLGAPNYSLPQNPRQTGKQLLCWPQNTDPMQLALVTPTPCRRVQVQGIIQEGPRANLQAFLSALSKLAAAIEFLKAQKHMATAADALAHASALRDRAVERAGAEFGALLGKHCHVPPALVALQRQSTAAALALDARQPEAGACCSVLCCMLWVLLSCAVLHAVGVWLLDVGCWDVVEVAQGAELNSPRFGALRLTEALLRDIFPTHCHLFNLRCRPWAGCK